MTVGDAKLELQRQSLARGFGGRLEDVDVLLTEDNKHVLLFLHYELDEPLIAGFDLPAPIAEEYFDYEGTSAGYWRLFGSSKKQF